MTSVLNVDTIAAKDGTSPVALTKQEASKAWFNFDGDPVSLNDSFNTSSVTDNAAGDYTPTLTSAMGNTDYAVVVGGQLRQSSSGLNLVFQIRAASVAGTPDTKSTTQVRMEAKRSDTSGSLDVGTAHSAFMGDLA